MLYGFGGGLCRRAAAKRLSVPASDGVWWRLSQTTIEEEGEKVIVTAEEREEKAFSLLSWKRMKPCSLLAAASVRPYSAPLRLLRTHRAMKREKAGGCSMLVGSVVCGGGCDYVAAPSYGGAGREKREL